MHLRAPGRRRHALLTIAVAVAAAGCSGSGASQRRDAGFHLATDHLATDRHQGCDRTGRRPPAGDAAAGSARAVLVADPAPAAARRPRRDEEHDRSRSCGSTPRRAPSPTPARSPIAVHDAAGAELAGRPTVFGGGNTSETAAVQAVGADGSDDDRPAARAAVGPRRRDRSPDACSSSAATTAPGCGRPRSRPPTASRSRCSAISRCRCGTRRSRPRGRDVYVVGGTTTGSASGAVAEIQALDTTTGAVRTVGRAPVPVDRRGRRRRCTATCTSSADWSAARPSDQIWRLDPPSGARPAALVPVATLPVPLADAAVAVDHDVAYVAGGESPALSSAVFSRGGPMSPRRPCRGRSSSVAARPRRMLESADAPRARRATYRGRPHDPAPHDAGAATAALDPRTGAGPGVDVYAHTRAGMLAPAVAGVRARVYVPNSLSNTVDVIDPTTLRVVDHFARRRHAAARRARVRPLDALREQQQGQLADADRSDGPAGPAPPIPVDDPYNLYFTPDGSRAIVMAERNSRVDFRDPHTWRLIRSVRSRTRASTTPTSRRTAAS